MGRFDRMPIADKTTIRNNKLLSALYRANSENMGEPFHYCVPMEMAEKLFGTWAKHRMMDVSQIRNVAYGCTRNGVTYIDVSGFNLMRDFRALEIFNEEVRKDDTGECTEHQSNSVSNKKKKVR